jgi:hypothetical protein
VCGVTSVVAHPLERGVDRDAGFAPQGAISELHHESPAVARVRRYR